MYTEIRELWVRIWRSGGNLDPRTLTVTTPLREGGAYVGDVVLVNDEFPTDASTPGPPGSTGTIVECLTQGKVRMQLDCNQASSTAVILLKYCTPCRGTIKSARRLKLATWLQTKVATTHEEASSSFILAIAERLLAHGISEPSDIDSLSPEWVCRQMTAADVGVPLREMNFIRRAVRTANVSAELRETQKSSITPRVDGFISSTKRARTLPMSFLSVNTWTQVPLLPRQVGPSIRSQFANYWQAQQWFQTATTGLASSQLVDESVRCYASALSSWGRFVDSIALLKGSAINHFPADLQLVYWWIATFLHPGTSSNYLSALKTAHAWQIIEPQ